VACWHRPGRSISSAACRRRKEQAQAQYLATGEARKAAQISLVATVANAWLALVADEELLDLSGRTLATREDSLKLTRLRFDQGSASELDLRQAESLVESARATLAQQVRQRAQDENALVLVWARACPTMPPGPAPGPPESGNAAEVPVGLPSELLTAPGHPPGRAVADRGQRQHRCGTRGVLPAISLTAGIGSASSACRACSRAAPGLPFAPAVAALFDAGRNQAGLETAQAARDIAVAQYEKAIQTAFREVADARRA
jgi:multidrug efflux system outer membrane protein